MGYPCPGKDGDDGQTQADGETTRAGKWLCTPLRCVLRHFPAPFLHPGGSTLNERYRVSFARALIPGHARAGVWLFCFAHRWRLLEPDRQGHPWRAGPHRDGVAPEPRRKDSGGRLLGQPRFRWQPRRGLAAPGGGVLPAPGRLWCVPSSGKPAISKALAVPQLLVWKTRANSFFKLTYLRSKVGGSWRPCRRQSFRSWFGS